MNNVGVTHGEQPGVALFSDKLCRTITVPQQFDDVFSELANIRYNVGYS